MSIYSTYIRYVCMYVCLFYAMSIVYKDRKKVLNYINKSMHPMSIGGKLNLEYLQQGKVLHLIYSQSGVNPC